MAKWTESMKEVQEINNLVSIEESKSVDEGIMSGIKTESLPSNFLDECIEIVNYITNGIFVFPPLISVGYNVLMAFFYNRLQLRSVAFKTDTRQAKKFDFKRRIREII